MNAALMTGLNQLEIRSVPDPVLPGGGVIVKMMSTAICGTDIKMLVNGHRDLALPRILGHEGAGIVVETDNNMFQTGDIVALNAGAVFWMAGKVVSLKEGVSAAKQVISKGNTVQKLLSWVRAQNCNPESGYETLKRLCSRCSREMHLA